MRQPNLIPILYHGEELYQNVGRYPYDILGQTEWVEDGQLSDGASVPRLAWWFMPPDGLQRAAALPHDDVYGRQGIMPSGRRIARAQADLMLYDRLVMAGVSKWRAVIVYRNVRAFGWHAWNNSTGHPIVLPVQNELRRLHRPSSNPFTRHIYELATP